jgi:hypothetical protein
MDFIKTLQSLEDAIYEVVIWTLFLPKTLFQIILRPSWIQGYITKEWEKKPEERFQAYLSPVIFWLLLAVIPFAWSFTLGLGKDNPQLTDSLVINSAISLLIAPVAYAVALERLHRKPIEKTSLKKSFYIQCYCHAPIQLFSLVLKVIVIFSFSTYIEPLQLISLARGINISNNIPSFFSLGALIYLLVLFIWQILLETFVFRQELKAGWMKAIGLVLKTQLIIFLIASPFVSVTTFTFVPK